MGVAEFKKSPLAYVWAAGVAAVLFHLLHHGCVHTTCSNGWSNVGLSVRSKTHKGSVRYHGLTDSAFACEAACVALDPKKGTCFSFMHFRPGSDLANQCFLNLEEKWAPVRDARVVTGRRYLLTPFTAALASKAAEAATHPKALEAVASFHGLVAAIGEWPVVTGTRAAAAKAADLAAALKAKLPALPALPAMPELQLPPAAADALAKARAAVDPTLAKARAAAEPARALAAAHAQLLLACALLLWPVPVLLLSGGALGKAAAPPATPSKGGKPAGSSTPKSPLPDPKDIPGVGDALKAIDQVGEGFSSFLQNLVHADKKKNTSVAA